MKKQLLFLIPFMYSLHLFGQSFSADDFPKEGGMVSDYQFNDLLNYPDNQVSISDFQGKWLVLDWWSLGCSGCIRSLPKMNKLNRDFKGVANFLMVGQSGKRASVAGIKKFYLTQQKKYDLTMPSAFDSASFNQFFIDAVPFILIIDPHGVIKVKTHELDSMQLAQIIAGKVVEHSYAYSEGEKRGKDYNYKLPYLTAAVQANGGIDTAFISRTVFSRWEKDTFLHGVCGFGGLNKALNNEASAFGVDLPQLLLIAYIGDATLGDFNPYFKKMNPNLIFEVKDKMPFSYGNEVKNENMYNFSFKTNETNPQKAKAQLLRTIEQTFNIKTHVEKRKVDVWKLIATDKTKALQLKSKNGQFDWQPINGYGGFSMTNGPFPELLNTLTMVLGFEEKEGRNKPVLINETGFDFNVDIVFEADMTDLKEVRTKLRSFGLDIVRGPYEMECILVRDAECH